jgi:hypothetical protein
MGFSTGGLAADRVTIEVMSAFEDVTSERAMSSWESGFHVFYGPRGPLVKRSLVAFVLVAGVVLFLLLRGGGDRRSFTFDH